VAARAGKSMVQLSLQWLLGRAAVDSVILGASRLAQLEENLAAAEGALDRDTSEACDQIYALLSGPIPRYNR
jgi:L-glyceraldehyde 3-phosphate reductase